MKKLLSFVGFVAAVAVSSMSTPTAQARNAPGGVNSPACQACLQRLRTEENCETTDVKDPRWSEGCARVVTRSLTECKKECLE
jgi:hypothetical protein